MSDNTAQVSSQFYNLTITKPTIQLEGSNAVTADYVTGKIADYVIPISAINPNDFLKKEEENQMGLYATIVFPNIFNEDVTILEEETNIGLQLGRGGITFSNPATQLKINDTDGNTLLSISDQGLGSVIPVELKNTSMNLINSQLNLTTHEDFYYKKVKLTEANIDLINGSSLNVKDGIGENIINSLSINSTDGISSALKVSFTNVLNSIDNLQTKYLSIGENWRIEEEPVTKNLLFKYKNPTTGNYEIGTPIIIPQPAI